ncbi:forkhead box Q2 [Denticeps clupeoides]|uniref:Fork-head domain-containing protein n=1 Tax=Denticeps clupeoides TaxID=299321 RepID=A0AAY4D1T6_9TELE|nr:forkhead box protein A1-B-like [Denticeps clupeoides]
MGDGNTHGEAQKKLGLRFTIDYLLFNKGDMNDRSRTEAKSPHSPPVKRGEETSISEENKRSSGTEIGTDSSEGENEEDAVRREETGHAEVQQDKPSHSYIALISMAILASEEKKLLLCDIYQWIMDNYPYFKSKDKNWRNSVRHNLSLNECFIKAGRSENGKGHFWAIHPANFHDFSNGDYHRRRTRRRIRRVTGQLLYGLPSFYSPLHRVNGVPGWCWPHNQPPPCLTTRIYWSWASLHNRHTPSYHANV